MSLGAVAAADLAFEEFAENNSSCLAATDLHFLRSLSNNHVSFRFKCRTASTHEIKTSYRKLALLLHPDRHDGDKIKVQAFKDASEAYSILSDTARRKQYDMAKFGGIQDGWYNRNRKTAPPGNYRKVYAPHPPPNGKWHDAQRHYDMHYGDGMYFDEIKRAQSAAKARGEYEYHSPLGKGFTFGPLEDEKDKNDDDHAYDAGDGDTNNNFNNNSYGSNSYYKNPFSKASQGPPPPPMWLYEEGYISEAKVAIQKKGNVAERLRQRREARRRQQEGESAINVTPDSNAYAATVADSATGDVNRPQYQAFNRSGGCSIM